jgi:hypothetical protein
MPNTPSSKATRFSLQTKNSLVLSRGLSLGRDEPGASASSGASTSTEERGDPSRRKVGMDDPKAAQSGSVAGSPSASVLEKGPWL